MSLEKGLIHVYTGPGKGKTQSALGLGLRAAGAGFKVYMIQFMKGRKYSELESIKHLPNFTIVQYGRDEFVSREKPEQIDIDLAQQGFIHATEIIQTGQHDMVILDEINVAIDFNLISIKDFLNVIHKKPDHVELVCTGRYANPDLVKVADVVTEMLEIKHPYQQGIMARKGIEYQENGRYHSLCLRKTLYSK